MLMRKSKSTPSARVMAFTKCRMSNDERMSSGRVGRLVEWKRNHFDSNRLGRFRGGDSCCDRIQSARQTRRGELGADVVETPFHISERDFLSFTARGACDPANFLPRR